MSVFKEADQSVSDTEGWPSIPEFYAGRSVFVTGGSGFMGKVLIEKLLRSCPDLRTIFLLLRPKKGKTPEERICHLTADPLFDRLRTEQPGALRKLRAVNGDVKELGLGLSAEDRQLLQLEVSVVFHAAASVRFDDALRDAVLVNVRGTRELLLLAQQMSLLEVLVHVSTTYCHFDKSLVMEQMYPALASWKTMIRLAESADNQHIVNLLNCLTPKLLGKLPNTYTFAKSLSEQLVNDFKDMLPLTIIRPSIVNPTAEEPYPGWTDNFNGPIGMCLGVAKGILRTVYADPKHKADYIQVDIAIRSLIVLAWLRAMRPHSDLPVFNACKMIEAKPVSEMIQIGLRLLPENPLGNALWHPNTTVTSNRTVFFASVLLYHMLPALLVDAVLKVTGRKPMLVKLQRRVYIASNVLSIFLFVTCQNDNTRFVNASKFIKPCDVDQFNYNKIATDADEICKTNLIGCKKFLLKDEVPLAEAKRQYQRMYWLDRLLKAAAVLTLTVVLCTCSRTQALLASLTSPDIA